MKIVPYLMFKGDAVEALEYYRDILDGEVTDIQYYKDAPEVEVKEDWNDKILHASLKFGNEFLYFCDAWEEDSCKPGNLITLMLEFESEDKLVKTFEALKKEGVVKMPLEEMFWGAKFGSIEDKYKINWGLNYSHS